VCPPPPMTTSMLGVVTRTTMSAHVLLQLAACVLNTEHTRRCSVMSMALSFLMSKLS
jgi:hypothetical protein